MRINRPEPRMRVRMSRLILAPVLTAAVLSLSGCDDPQIYGSVGMSTGYGGYYGGYGGWSQPRMHTSISIGGRIR
jgi:hypothetical protein